MQAATSMVRRPYFAVDSEDLQYPARLKVLASYPRTIWAMGNVSLLERAAIGICGSRDASPKGIEHARHFSDIAAKLGLAVVSGYSRGIDHESHIGALQSGGATIAVLPNGIEHFRPLGDMNRFSDLWERLLVVSEFSPSLPWSVWSAMRRNSTICALANAMVVVESRETGGTLAAGKECLKQRKPLLVIQYSEARESTRGNTMLIAKGGEPMHTLKELRQRLESLAKTATP